MAEHEITLYVCGYEKSCCRFDPENVEKELREYVSAQGLEDQVSVEFVDDYCLGLCSNSGVGVWYQSSVSKNGWKQGTTTENLYQITSRIEADTKKKA